MTISLDIPTLFPYLHRETYYNTAGASLCPSCIQRKVCRFVEDLCQENGAAYERYSPDVSNLRQGLARLLHASPHEIAILHNTAEAASIIANGIDWRAGDMVMTLNKEYPSTIYPWMMLERHRGVELVMLEERKGQLDEAEIAAQIRRQRPRLFAISAVEWCSGYRFDLATIGKACEEMGTFFFVDAAQSLGFWDLDVNACRVSAVGGASWKWLFGPAGQGYLYLNRNLLESVRPVNVGSDSVINALDYLNYDLTFHPDMRRFEFSTANLSGLVWFNAGLEFVNELGMGNIRSHVFDLQNYAIRELKALGCEVRGELRVQPSGVSSVGEVQNENERQKSNKSDDPTQTFDHRSGIMAFRHPKIASKQLSQRLASEAHIFAKERDGFVRLAFHVYNTKAGITELVELLK